jgi:4-amino-4-deoxy-L-arabinose transferase-like glycosyltransferase
MTIPRADPTAGNGRKTRRIKVPMLRRHWQLVVLLTLYVCLATAFSLVLPLGEADDETDHFALVRFIVDNGRPPLTIGERNAIGPKGDAAPIYHGLVALLTQHVDVASLPDLPATQSNPLRLIPTDGFQGDRILHTEDELPPWRGIVLAWHLARLLSVPLGAATVVAAYATAQRLWPQRRWLAVGAASCVAFLPRLAISGGVVTDDALALPLMAWAVYGLVRLAQGDRRRVTCLWLGATIGLATITKYSNLVLVPEAAFLVALPAWSGVERRRDDGAAPSAAVKTAAGRSAWLALAFGATAAWYFIWLWVNFNQVTELGWWRGSLSPLGDPVLTSAPGQGGGIWDSSALGVWAWLGTLFRSFWLSYGWQHYFAPGWVNWSLGALCGLAGLGWLTTLVRAALPQRRGTGDVARLPAPATPVAMRLPTFSADRAGLLILLVHLFLVTAVVVLRGWLKPSPETAQGRHLYPAIVPLSLFLVCGLDRLAGLVAWHGRDGKKVFYAVEVPGVALIGVVSMALFALAAATWPLILAPHYVPYLPIRRLPVGQAPPQSLAALALPPGVRLTGLDMSVAAGSCGISTAEELGKPMPYAGDSLAVTRTWYVARPQPRDYLIRMCLTDASGRVVICHHSQPVDGRYPMRAWEAGYMIRDTAELPLPACLPAGTYSVHMAVLPLRLDTPLVEVDRAADSPEEITVGQVCVLPQAVWNASLDSFDVWTAEGKVSTGRLDLHRLRQSATLVAIRTLSDSVAADLSGVALVPDPPTSHAHDLPEEWLPVAPPTEYRCPNGALVRGHSFMLHPAVAPGLYRPVGETLPDQNLVISVDVRPRRFASPPTLSDGTAVPAAFGESASSQAQLTLLDYDVQDATIEPGASVSVMASWQARLAMHRPAVVSLYLLDSFGGVGGQADRALGGHYSNVLWAPGEVVEEAYQLLVRPETPPGLYSVQLGVYHYDPPDRGENAVPQFLRVRTGAGDLNVTHLDLGRVRVRDAAENTLPSTAVGVDLGDMLSLVGYDLNPPAGMRLVVGQTLNLTLYWQALRRPTRDFTVFTQLVGPDGRVHGQQDNQPQGGRYPTTAWDVAQMVIDRYALTVPDGAPRGQYRLLVGMYDLATGVRLPAVRANGTPLADDAIELTTLVVE